MDYLSIITTEGERIARVARQGPLEGRIPHMARWSMSDVLAHLGGVHRWAERIVANRSFDGVRHRRGADTGEALITWFEEGVAKLVGTLSAADPDEECGNFSPGSPNRVGFWYRRQAHETTMHRWDVEAAAGTHEPIEAAFATDGIDELFHTFTRVRGKQVLAHPIGIATTDTGSRWTLAPAASPGRVDLASDVEAVAELAGPAQTLLLALWKRIPLDHPDLTLNGAEAVIQEFVAGPISA